MTIVIGLVLLLLALFGAPLFSIIAASAMLGFLREGIDLQVLGAQASHDDHVKHDPGGNQIWYPLFDSHLFTRR